MFNVQKFSIKMVRGVNIKLVLTKFSLLNFGTIDFKILLSNLSFLKSLL